MKILCLSQDVKDVNTLNKGIVLATEWCKTIGLDLKFDFRNTVKKFSSIPNEIGGHTVNPTEIFQEGKATGLPFDIVLLVYDADKITPRPTNPADYGMSISIPTFWYATFPEVFAEFLLHEICHYFFQMHGTNDITHLYVTGFNTRKEWYLHLLKPFAKTIPAPVTTYKYFSQAEVNKWKLKPELWEMLDRAREIAGVPFKITSGLRSGQSNEEVGGVGDSSHLDGSGCDLRARNSTEHYFITKGLYGAGFRRISRNYPTHIHCDISKDKIQDVLF